VRNVAPEPNGGQQRTAVAAPTREVRKKRRKWANGARVEIAGAVPIGAQVIVLPVLIGARIDHVYSLARWTVWFWPCLLAPRWRWLLMRLARRSGLVNHVRAPCSRACRGVAEIGGGVASDRAVDMSFSHDGRI
jgi:hypothetical protein